MEKVAEKATESLSIKITKTERLALTRAAAKEAMKTGEKMTITALIRRALAKYLTKATS